MLGGGNVGFVVGQTKLGVTAPQRGGGVVVFCPTPPPPGGGVVFGCLFLFGFCFGFFCVGLFLILGFRFFTPHPHFRECFPPPPSPFHYLCCFGVFWFLTLGLFLLGFGAGLGVHCFLGWWLLWVLGFLCGVSCFGWCAPPPLAPSRLPRSVHVDTGARFFSYLPPPNLEFWVEWVFFGVLCTHNPPLQTSSPVRLGKTQTAKTPPPPQYIGPERPPQWIPTPPKTTLQTQQNPRVSPLCGGSPDPGGAQGVCGGGEESIQFRPHERVEVPPPPPPPAHHGPPYRVDLTQVGQ